MKEGRTILVIRPDGRFSGLLRECGFTVLNLPLIATVPAADLNAFRKKLGRLDEYDGLFFTSPAAAEIFVGESAGRDALYGGRVYVLGRRAKTVLENAGYNVAYLNGANSAEELISGYGTDEFAGRKFLFVRGDRSVRTIPEMLAGDAAIDEMEVYRTVDLVSDGTVVDDVRGRLGRKQIDWICFFSPSGVDAFCRSFEPSAICSAKIAAIGPTTARRAEINGIEVAFVSGLSESEEFARELIEHIRNSE